MKTISTLIATILCLQVFAQEPLVDGVYKYAKITVGNNRIISVDSMQEFDPTVNYDIKTITNTDLNHWNEAYLRVYDYPSWSTLVYYINYLWIPQTTNDLAEGTNNWYFTPTRFNNAFSAKSTSDLLEGTNKYYTDLRSRQAISLTTTGTGAATYNSSTGVLNIPTPSGGSGGVTSVGLTSTDFTVSGSPITTSGNITANLSNTGVSAGKYDWVTVDAKGRVTAAGNMATPTSISSGGRNFNQAYQISTTQQASITVSASCQVALGVLGSGTGTAFVEISANGSSGWIFMGNVCKNSANLVGLTSTNGGSLTVDIPAGYYYRISTTSSTSGVGNTVTFTFDGGNFTTY